MDRVVSGGQTGVDRAALDVALELGIPVGGWCPAGRWAEDGRIPERYPLRETESRDPGVRTEWNVRDSDATLILTPPPLAGGTQWTAKCARRFGRPLWIADPWTDPHAAIRSWLGERRVAVLNVGGPRESEVPGIYRSARRLLLELLGG